MGLAIRCAYCGKPLLDEQHARTHVVNQCEASPTKALADALETLIKTVREYASVLKATRVTGRLYGQAGGPSLAEMAAEVAIRLAEADRALRAAGRPA